MQIAASMQENNSPTTNVSKELGILHKDIEMEVDIFKAEVQAAKKLSSSSLEEFVHQKASAIVAYYTPLFQEITSHALAEYADPDFSVQCSEVALNLGYMYKQLDNCSKVISMYELAAIRTRDPLLQFTYNVVGLRHRVELYTMFSETETSFHASLKNVAKQFSILFTENSQEALLQTYIESSVPLGLLIRTLEEIKVDTITEEKARFAALSYLYARTGNIDSSNDLARKTVNAGGSFSTSLCMFMSDIYKWWHVDRPNSEE